MSWLYSDHRDLNKYQQQKQHSAPVILSEEADETVDRPSQLY
jgi:hypothetical protein